MGLFDFIFPNKKKNDTAHYVNQYFETMNAYTPVFTTNDGGLYEMELTRAAINSFATAVSKLKPEFQGDVYQNLGKRSEFKMNAHMVTSKFLYRVATILSVNTTAIIIPIYDDDTETIKGYYPILPSQTDVIDVNGQAWLRFSFPNGEKSALEVEKVGILTQYQFKNEFFGDGNSALQPTLSLMDIQKQAMEDAIKQSASIRFIARLGSTLRPDDIEAERKRFSESNLSSTNNTGVMMFDKKYEDVIQVNSNPYVIDNDQMELIKNNVFSYFGVNEDIIQNKFDEDTWNAYYEGKIEPFALQLGLVMTDMTFTEDEIEQGNYIMFTTNRLQYASNRTKLSMSSQLLDRGVLSRNEVREIWNMSPIEDGDDRYIRREYGKVGEETDDDGIQEHDSDDNTDRRYSD